MDAINNNAALDAAKEYATANLAELSAEILEYNQTSILCEGKLRKLWSMVSFVGHSAQVLAIRLVEEAALQSCAIKAAAEQERSDIRLTPETLERMIDEYVNYKGNLRDAMRAAGKVLLDDIKEKFLSHPPAAQQDQWKESLIERCVIAGTTFNPDDPESTLTNLINWEVTIATDPKVSGAQQDSERLAFVLEHGLPSKIEQADGSHRFFLGIVPFDGRPTSTTAIEAIDAAMQAEKGGK